MKLFISLILILALTSCVEFTSDKRFATEYIVMSGTIYAGETITLESPIFIGRSVSVNIIDIRRLFISDAQVYITDIETSISQDLSFGYDEDNFKIGYYDPSESFIIESGKTYRLTAIVGRDTVWAETTVPQDFEILENSGYTYDVNSVYPKMVFNEIDEFHTITLRVTDEIETVVYLEHYCLEEFEDATFIRTSGLIERTLESEEDYESFMSGFPRRSSFIFNYFPSLVEGELLVRTIGNSQDFIFYRRHRVTVAVVDENFFKYRYKSMSFFQGGINNGIGFFGSAVRKILYTDVVSCASCV